MAAECHDIGMTIKPSSRFLFNMLAFFNCIESPASWFISEDQELIIIARMKRFQAKTFLRVYENEITAVWDVDHNLDKKLDDFAYQEGK